MEFSLKEKDKYIDRLSSVTASIKSIYDQMKNYKTKDELEKLKEYLDIALKVEDKIYSELDKDLAKESSFIRRINYKISISNLDNKTEIANRIIVYLAQKDYLNPFCSDIPNPIDNINENSAIISTQVCIDFFKSVLMYSNKALQNENNPNNRKRILDQKYDIYFINKVLTQIISTERNLKIDGRKRCILFKQPEELVSNIYREYLYSIITNSFYIILNTEDSLLPQINLKAALAILDKMEIFQMIDFYENSLRTNPTINKLAHENEDRHIIITNILSEFFFEEKNIEEQKKRPSSSK